MEPSDALTDPMEPEELWRHLLSGESQLVRAAWNTLDGRARENVRRHLQAMACEEGWQPGQRRSARIALECLSNLMEE